MGDTISWQILPLLKLAYALQERRNGGAIPNSGKTLRRRTHECKCWFAITRGIEWD